MLNSSIQDLERELAFYNDGSPELDIYYYEDEPGEFYTDVTIVPENPSMGYGWERLNGKLLSQNHWG